MSASEKKIKDVFMFVTPIVLGVKKKTIVTVMTVNLPIAQGPQYGQIKSFDLTNVLVAVVRYYGGTNLGVGGLMNAYRTAAKGAFENASIIEDEERNDINIRFPYAAMPFVMNAVKSSNCRIIHKDFGGSPSLRISIPISNQQLIDDLKSIDGVSLFNQGLDNLK